MKKSGTAIQAARTIGHIVMGLVVIILATLLVRKLAVPLVESVVELDAEPMRNVSSMLNLLAVGVFYTCFVKVYEKRPVQELEFKGLPLIYGSLLGASLIGVTIIPLFVLGYYQVDLQNGVNDMWLVILPMIAREMLGAFIFTGVVFRNIEKELGSLYSISVVAVLLGLMNIMVDGLNIFAMASMIVMSAIWCALFIIFRNLWVVGLAAGSWHYMIFATGLLDEHWRVNAPIISSSQGPDFLTGGVIGPAGSSITIVFGLMCFIFLYKKMLQLPTEKVGNSKRLQLINNV